MTLATDKKKFTPEEFLDLPDAVSYELVDGELVERKMGSESSVIGMLIGTILTSFIRGKRMGFIGGADCSYQCFPDSPNRVRKPDVSFVRSGRLPDDRPPKGHTRIPPDLAVEVLSPGDVVSEVREYLAAGVKLIWVVNPEMRTVTIHRPADAKLGPISALADAIHFRRGCSAGVLVPRRGVLRHLNASLRRLRGSGGPASSTKFEGECDGDSGEV